MTLGMFQIRYYGFIIVAAILVGAILAARFAKRDGRDPDHIWGALFWAVILGIIAARLWYVLFPPVSMTAGCGIPGGLCRDTAWYFENFFNLQDGAIAIWSGGLSIFGAFIGGALGSIGYLRANKQPLAPWFDIAGVVVPLSQAIGRFANYVNQELYGIPTGVSWWGIPIESNFRVGIYRSTVEFPPDTLFHPLFLYEAVWSVAAFFVLRHLWINYRHQFKPGTIFLLFVAQYAFIRFLLEFLRVEVSLVGGVNTSQAFTALAFVVAVALLIPRLRARDRSATPQGSSASSAPPKPKSA